jgi:short-subunit dehydrogenase
MSHPVAFITGASSGIGHALALEYARRGHDLVILARRAERLQQLAEQVQAAGAQALAVAGDVSVDGDLEKAARQALDRFGRIDVSIANAGISVAAPFDRLSLDQYRRVFETNVFGVLRTAQATFDALKQSHGSFAAIGSVNGYVALAGSSPYVASKFAVRGLCDALYQDFALHGVSVTHIAPGFIESEIRQVDNRGTLREDRKDPIPSWLVMPAATAARQIADAITDRQREAVITLHGKAAASLARHAPGFVSGVLRLVGRRGLRDKS